MLEDLDGQTPGQEPWRRQFRQFIPRPASSTMGRPAPWAGVAPGRRRVISCETVKADLTPRLVPAESEPDDRPHAAVLVPIFERDGQATLVLIRRGFMLSSSPGDLAFPGGRIEAGERAVDAAVRESEEEVALRPETLTLLGRLSGVSRPRFPGWVAPYVALLDSEPSLVPAPVEVDGVLTVSLADLAADGAFWQEEWDVPGQGERLLSFFATASLGHDVIWGLTARIVTELLSELLLGA
ncbi:MAG: NUDIX hydrolase [Acidimicrobiales bacterium]